MRKESIMMKLIRMLTRGIRDAFKSVFRNFSLSIASVSCISITLVVVAIAIVASWNVNSITDSIKKDVTIVVFVNQKATDLDLERIDSELRDIKNIESVVLKTKEQELTYEDLKAIPSERGLGALGSSGK
jgi:cell division transport system permease protein